jgi:uncharacterized coiled-coil DUF342 family protein
MTKYENPNDCPQSSSLYPNVERLRNKCNALHDSLEEAYAKIKDLERLLILAEDEIRELRDVNMRLERELNEQSWRIDG